MHKEVLNMDDWLKEVGINLVSSRRSYDEYRTKDGVTRLVNISFKYRLANTREMFEDYLDMVLITEFAQWVERVYVNCEIEGGGLPDFLHDGVQGSGSIMNNGMDLLDWYNLYINHGPWPTTETIEQAVSRNNPPGFRAVFQRRAPWTILSGYKCTRCGAEGGQDFGAILYGRFVFGWVPEGAVNREILFRRYEGQPWLTFDDRKAAETLARHFIGFGVTRPMTEETPVERPPEGQI